MSALPATSDNEVHDRELERRVALYLDSRHISSLRRVKVNALGGVVTLTGRVRTFHERQVGLLSARRVAGVVRIVDRILVDTTPGENAERRPSLVFSLELERYFASQVAAAEGRPVSE